MRLQKQSASEALSVRDARFHRETRPSTLVSITVAAQSTVASRFGSLVQDSTQDLKIYDANSDFTIDQGKKLPISPQDKK